MKKYTFILFLMLIASCSETEKEKMPSIATVERESYGNIHIKEQFEKHYPLVKVYEDSVTKQDFLLQPLKRVTCNANNSLNDFYGDGPYYREKAFTINDTLTLNIIEKQDKGSQYIYFYKGRPFEVINYTSGESAPDAGYHFFLEDRDCWQLTRNKYLMAETPSGWCGTILQFEFYQVVDFDKMEIIQFIDKRLK
jgi:hypothetical protein